MADAAKGDNVIVNGDFIRHGIALYDPSGDKNETWTKIKSIMTTDM